MRRLIVRVISSSKGNYKVAVSTETGKDGGGAAH